MNYIKILIDKMIILILNLYFNNFIDLKVLLSWIDQSY